MPFCFWALRLVYISRQWRWKSFLKLSMAKCMEVNWSQYFGWATQMACGIRWDSFTYVTGNVSLLFVFFFNRSEPDWSLHVSFPYLLITWILLFQSCGMLILLVDEFHWKQYIDRPGNINLITPRETEEFYAAIICYENTSADDMRFTISYVVSTIFH